MARKGTRRRSVSRAARRGAVRVRRGFRRAARTRAAQELGPIVMQGGKDALGVLGGKVASRMASGALKQAPGSVLGLLIEAGTGLAGAVLLEKVSTDSARMFCAGAFSGVLERVAVRARLPYVGGYLGDPMFEGLAAYDPPGGYLSADELVEVAAQLQGAEMGEGEGEDLGDGDEMGAYVEGGGW